MKLIKVEETTTVRHDGKISKSTKQVYEPEAAKDHSILWQTIAFALLAAFCIVAICLIKA